MKNKRHKILEAAEKMMSAKGRGATISEISAASGVTDSVLYHYFKNKEDILFSVAQEHLRDALEKLDEQLQGIMDPANQLGKLIWFQLYYHDTYPDYGNLLLFECRSNNRFMKHEAYGLIKRDAGHASHPEVTQTFVSRIYKVVASFSIVVARIVYKSKAW